MPEYVEEDGEHLSKSPGSRNSGLQWPTLKGSETGEHKKTALAYEPFSSLQYGAVNALGSFSKSGYPLQFNCHGSQSRVLRRGRSYGISIRTGPVSSGKSDGRIEVVRAFRGNATSGDEAGLNCYRDFAYSHYTVGYTQVRPATLK